MGTFAHMNTADLVVLLNAALKRQKKTQLQLAEKLDLSKTQVNEVLLGRRNVSLEQLATILDFLNIKLVNLVDQVVIDSHEYDALNELANRYTESNRARSAQIESIK